MKFYLDTSIFGGLFDKEFEKQTHALFEFIEKKDIKIIYSDVLEDELELAPQKIKFMANQKLLKAEYVQINEEMTKLTQVAS
jgi:hypothetical protein